MPLNQNTLYQNRGNESVLRYIGEGDRQILDVGCGAGDTGRLIKSMYPDTKIVGITCSQQEYDIAQQVLNQCIYGNVEVDHFSELEQESFDVICFCHVLEHLLDPVAVIRKFLPYLKSEGKVIIALPNIANWRSRIKLVLGQFEYTDSGLMDRTHLRFYTFHTAPKYLIEPISELSLKIHKVNGSVPLALLRHHFLPSQWKEKIDQWGCQIAPNFFGGEIIIVVTT